MKLLVYYHDLHLPYSAYLVRAFLESPAWTQVDLCGPRPVSGNAIFAMGDRQDSGLPPLLSLRQLADRLKRRGPAGVSAGARRQAASCKEADLSGCRVITRSSRINWRWFRFAEFLRLLGLRRPDVVLVLDEAFSWDVLQASLAMRLVRGYRGQVLFYGFENIVQAPPVGWFLRKPGPGRLASLVKKTARAIFLDWLPVPLRWILAPRGLYAYPECATIIHRQGWRPMMAESWFPVDTPLFFAPPSEDPGALTALASRLRLGADEAVVLFAGRLIAEKGLAGLIRGVGLSGKKICLLLVGSGPEEAALAALAQTLAGDKRVVWCGPQTAQGLRQHMALARLLVLPSLTGTFWKEQLGRVLLEAMAAGLEVAGSDSGAIPHVIGDRSHIFRENDPQDIARVIDFCLDHPRNPETLRARAQKASPGQFMADIRTLALKGNS